MKSLFLMILIVVGWEASAVSIVDHRGKKLEIASHPMKIASGALGSDEVLYEILRRKNQTVRLIAVSIMADNPTYSNIVDAAKGIPARVGSSTEAIVTLRPDIVFLASYNRIDLVQQIESAGVPVFVLGNFNSLNDVMGNIATIGAAIDESITAAEVIQDLRTELDVARARLLPVQPALSLLTWSPDGTVVGKKTILNDLLNYLGLRNSAAEAGLEGWPKLALEKTATLNPDWILIAADEGQSSHVRESLARSPGHRSLNAVRTGKVVMVPERTLSSVSHHLGKAGAAIAEALTAPQGTLPK